MAQDKPLEHVTDLASGQESDRPFKGVQPPGVGATEAEALRKRQSALRRLRRVARTDTEHWHIVADLLTVLGLDE